jgi:phospholipase/carboxylesterase
VTLDGLTYRARPAQGEPEGTLVLLHGRGADEHDLAPLLDLLDPGRQFFGVLPRGPLALPPGGAHWYVVREIGHPDRETFEATYELLQTWIDALPELTGVPLSRTVIGGFSQGSVMSFALGLGSSRPSPAGVIGLSGFLPTVDGFELALGSRAGLPVAIGHGTADPVISVEFSRLARGRLEAAGLDVLYRESVMGHSIDPAFVAELRPWLSGVV